MKGWNNFQRRILLELANGGFSDLLELEIGDVEVHIQEQVRFFFHQTIATCIIHIREDNSRSCKRKF